MKLGVDAPQRILAVLVVPLNRSRTHRKRLASRQHSSEPASPPRRAPQHRQVELGGKDLVGAADVGSAERLVCVQERAGASEALGRIDHLLADHPAAATFGGFSGRGLRW